MSIDDAAERLVSQGSLSPGTFDRALWSFWHFPLIFIKGTYQSGLMVNPVYVVNFFIRGIPLAFIVITNREMFFETKHVGRLLETRYES